MRNLRSQPTNWFWNFVGLGLCVFLCGSGLSISRARSYQIELAQYKLAVGTALSEVKKVSDTLERSAESSAIAPQEKQRIHELTQKSDAVIQQVESEIEAETNKLTFIEGDL